MSSIREVTLTDGDKRYRVIGDVARGTRRRQKVITCHSREEAEAKAAELDKLSVYMPRRGRRPRQARELGLRSVAELLASGECDGKCLTAFMSDDCDCRCGGRWHGALIAHYVTDVDAAPDAGAIPPVAPHIDDMEATVVQQGLRAVRRHRGLSQEALAAAAGMNPGSYNRIENGKLQPSLAQLIGIASVLGLRHLTIDAIEHIFGRSEP